MFDVQSNLIGAHGDDLAIHRLQTIPDEYLEHLRCARDDSAQRAVGELHRAASVPVSVVEIWLRQGFDFYRAKPREIVARLQAHDLGAFVTTVKAI